MLGLSKYACTSAIHFLTGELPIEGLIHRDMFALFYSLWSNPELKVHKIVKYLLNNTNNNSRTWSTHMRHISSMYSIDDPSELLCRDPPTKSTFKEYIKSKIIIFHENELRRKSLVNSKMKYFNVTLSGLNGKLHPAIQNITTTQEVTTSRPHIKMLTGNYLTYKLKSEQNSNISPHCRICLNGDDETQHILTSCLKTESIRMKILSEIRDTCQFSLNQVDFKHIENDKSRLCQFILDPSSLNLPTRININDPILPRLFKLSRDYCFAVDKKRISYMNAIKC